MLLFGESSTIVRVYPSLTLVGELPCIGYAGDRLGRAQGMFLTLAVIVVGAVVTFAPKTLHSDMASLCRGEGPSPLGNLQWPNWFAGASS